MNIDALNLQNVAQPQSNKGPDQASDARKKIEDTVSGEQAANKQVQPEEMLQQIKALTEDGLYSVRFENDERTNGLVVKIVDHEKDEVIRQFPAEEVLNLKVAMEDLRGNIVNTEG